MAPHSRNRLTVTHPHESDSVENTAQNTAFIEYRLVVQNTTKNTSENTAQNTTKKKMDTIRCAVRKFQHAVRTFTASSDLTVLTVCPGADRKMAD